ncbi:MAG: asparagine synthase (glutamine-hydrolyzing) [Proteobacteria bacterium]|nr:asparagine synthase (glutamine-hydrolyzing) [Pseudomonadota bacterium]
MCGFILAYAKHSATPLSDGTLNLMSAVLRHRGPDEHGILSNGPLAGAHRRLSIIDLAGGKQPMVSPDGRFTLLYNGEIYNFMDVRSELESHGVAFREHSDSEVLLQAWQRWGADCLSRLDGMFAFAIHDARTSTLHAARDRFGEKPVYYVQTDDALILASELKALVAAGLVEKRINPSALYSYLTLGYVVGEETIFKGVRKLGPAGLLRYAPVTGLKVERWWRPPMPSDEIEDADYAASETLRILRQSVSRRMIADVPVGFFLSGGVDSSAIVALAAEASSSPLETFSIGFDDARLDERPFAKFVADRFGTRHTELVVEPQHLDVLERIAWHADEPFADSAALPTWFLSEMTSQRVKVALSGDGADELFAGYDVYRGHMLSERVRRLPWALRRAATAALRASARLIRDNEPRLRLAQNISDASLPAVARFIAKQQTIFRNDFVRRYFPRLAPWATEEADLELFADMSANTPDVLGRIALWHQCVSLPDDMLHKVDRMSMAHSLEVRAPFLDHRLVELMNRTSFGAKLPQGRQKFILRKAMAAYYPEEFLWRPKQGFRVPLSRWFKGNLAGFAADRLSRPDSCSGRILAPGTLDTILADHKSGAKNWQAAIWALLMLEEWARAYDIPADAFEFGDPAAPAKEAVMA